MLRMKKYPRVIHLLHNGYTLCGLGPTPDKPIGHLWVGFPQIEKVDCEDCTRELQALKDILAAITSRQ